MTWRDNHASAGQLASAKIPVEIGVAGGGFATLSDFAQQPLPPSPDIVTSGATFSAHHPIPNISGQFVGVAMSTPAAVFLDAPGSPVLGQKFAVSDLLKNSGTYSIMIAVASGVSIGGASAGQAFVISENGLQVEFIYVAANTWQIFSTLYSTTLVNNLLDSVILGGYVGKPSASQKSMVNCLPHAITLPANLVGSQAAALTAATASAAFAFSYVRAGANTVIATITFAAGGTVGTFSGITIPTLQPGDVLVMTAPSTPDTTLADIGIAILGVKQ